MPKTFRPIKRTKFERFLVFIGCSLVRKRGDHLIYDKPGLRRPIVITANIEVPAFHIRTNLRTLNMSYTQFVEIMKKIK